MSLPQVKSISDYSNINVSDIFTFSLPLHTQIPLETEPFWSLVYVSTICTMHTRSCVIKTLTEYTRHAFAMLTKETKTLIKESSRYTSSTKKKKKMVTPKQTSFAVLLSPWKVIMKVYLPGVLICEGVIHRKCKCNLSYNSKTLIKLYLTDKSANVRSPRRYRPNINRQFPHSEGPTKVMALHGC